MNYVDLWSGRRESNPVGWSGTPKPNQSATTAWSEVRESNPSDWFGRPTPEALGQPRVYLPQHQLSKNYGRGRVNRTPDLLCPRQAPSHSASPRKSKSPKPFRLGALGFLIEKGLYPSAPNSDAHIRIGARLLRTFWGCSEMECFYHLKFQDAILTKFLQEKSCIDLQFVVTLFSDAATPQSRPPVISAKSR